jgi:hypothetical protein
MVVLLGFLIVVFSGDRLVWLQVFLVLEIYKFGKKNKKGVGHRPTSLGLISIIFLVDDNCLLSCGGGFLHGLNLLLIFCLIFV